METLKEEKIESPRPNPMDMLGKPRNEIRVVYNDKTMQSEVHKEVYIASIDMTTTQIKEVAQELLKKEK